MNILNTIIIPSLLLLVLDLAWITGYMGPKYNKQILNIQGEKMKVKPVLAILSYILMIVGLTVFVIPRIRKGYELEDSIRYGFTFGLVLYGVYDFTAATVIKNWDMKIAVIDVLWGGFVYFITTYISSKIKNN